MTSGLPFDDIRELAGRLPEPDKAAAERVRMDLSRAGQLGRLEELAAWFSAATGRVPARVTKPVVALFAGTHLVSQRLGIADPAADARARVEAIAAGAAPVSQLCAVGNLGLNVFDLALEIPVQDIGRGAALDERAAAATMAFGMEVLATGADLVCLGTVDSAGDPSAMALLSALGGSGGEEWSDADQEVREVVTEALAFHRGHLQDPLEALCRLAGREIAALAGAIVAARMQKVAVIVDGLSATAAAAAIHALNPNALSHCLLAGADGTSHSKAAARIGLYPVLDLGLSGNGGVGAAVAAGLVKAAGEVSAGVAEAQGRAG